jgi:rRNA maturation endonuclease Nob1
MPLPALGLLGMLGNIGRAGSMGYRAFKTARAAQPAAKQLLKYEGSGLQKGLAGLARGERKLFKKSPLTAGGIETGLSAPFAAEGVMDVGKGLYENDYGQVASGLGTLALTVPFLGRGLRMTGASKKIPASVRDPIYQTGKEVQKRLPSGKTFAPGLALTGVGAFTERPDAQAQAEDPRVLGDDPVQMVIQAIENDKKNPNIDTTSPDYKKQAQQILTNAYQAAGESGIKSPVTMDKIAETFTFETRDPNLKGKIVDDTKLPNDNGSISGTVLSDDEIIASAKMQEGTASAGKKLKENSLSKANAEEADQFNRFYDRIQNLTGGNTNTNDLILMKLASGLLQAKTPNSGVRGFLDAFGQAGGETIDTAMALYSKEADRRNNLAVAFLKSKEKGKDDGINRGFGKVTGKRQRVLVEDPNALFGRVAYDKDVFEKSGQDAIMIPKFDEQGNEIGTEFVPMKYAEYNVIDKPSQSRLDKKRAQLGSIAMGIKMTDEIQKLSNKAIGGSGVISLGAENLLGAVENFGEMFGFGDIADVRSDEFDNEIIENMIKGVAIDKKTGEVRELNEEEEKEQNELIREYKNDIRSLKEQVSSDGTMTEITRAKLIETRMKYILANANKDEDRLTRADIEDAAKNTEIFRIFTSDRKIRNQYQRLNEELQGQFKNKGQQYIALGGNTRYITTNYHWVPEVAEYLDKQRKLQAGQAVQQNMLQDLESIQ